MENIQLGTIVARRELTLDSSGKVTVVIGQPYPVDDGRTYFCPYQITGIGRGSVRRTGGVDSVQALFLALQMIGTDLYTSDEYQAQRLNLDGDVDLGFPVPDSISDLLPKNKQ